MMLRFLRKLCQRSENTTAALMSIPRPVSQVWSDSGFDTLEMIFDGERLIVTPQKG